jgi:hypothetical protein
VEKVARLRGSAAPRYDCRPALALQARIGLPFSPPRFKSNSQAFDTISIYATCKLMRFHCIMEPHFFRITVVTEVQKLSSEQAKLHFRMQALKALMRVRKARLRQSHRGKPTSNLQPALWDLETEMSACQEQLRILRRLERRRKRL